MQDLLPGMLPLLSQRCPRNVLAGVNRKLIKPLIWEKQPLLSSADGMEEEGAGEGCGQPLQRENLSWELSREGPIHSIPCLPLAQILVFHLLPETNP